MRWGLVALGVATACLLGAPVGAQDGFAPDNRAPRHAPASPAEPGVPRLDAEHDGVTPLSDEALRDLVDALGADTYAAREAAMRALIDQGDRAIPALRAATRRRNLEIQWRAKHALRLCEWGVTTALAELLSPSLAVFQRTAEPRERRRIVTQWAQRLRERGTRLLRKICVYDQDSDVRKEAFDQLGKLWGSDQVDALAQVADEVAARWPFDRWMHRALASAYVAAGKQKRAIVYLEKLVASEPDVSADVYQQLGELYKSTDALDKAVVAFEQALSRTTAPQKRWSLRLALGACYADLGKLARARTTWEAELSEDAIGYYRQVIEFYFQRGMLDDVTRLAGIATGKWPKDLALRRILIRGWEEHFALEPLIPLYAAELEAVDPSAPTEVVTFLAVRYAHALHQAQRDDEAVKVLEAERARPPQSASLALRLLSNLWDWGLYPAAKVWAEALVAKNPENTAIEFAIIDHAIRCGNLAAARERLAPLTVKLLARPQPYPLDLIAELIERWALLGDGDRVTECRVRLLGANDRAASVDAVSRTAIALAAGGRVDEAIALLESARARFPALVGQLIDFHVGRGDYAEAAALLRALDAEGSGLASYQLDQLRALDAVSGKPGAVFEQAIEALATNFNSRTARTAVTWAAAAGKLEAVVAALDGHLNRAGGEDEIARWWLAELAMRRGDAARVLALFDAERARGESPAVIRMVLWALMTTGQFEIAESLARDVLDTWSEVMDAGAPYTEPRIRGPLLLVRVLSRLGFGREVAAKITTQGLAGTVPPKLTQLALAEAYAAAGASADAYEAALRASFLVEVDYEHVWVARALAASETKAARNTVEARLRKRLKRVVSTDDDGKLRVARVGRIQIMDLVMLGRLYDRASRVDEALALFAAVRAAFVRRDNDYTRAYALSWQARDRLAPLDRQPLAASDRDVPMVGALTPATAALLELDVALRHGRAAYAEQVAQAVATQEPSDFRLKYLWREALRAQAREAAFPAAERARLAQPTVSDQFELYRAAFYFTMIGRLALAERIWNKLLELQPPETTVRTNSLEYRGRLYLKLGRPKKAVPDLRAAIAALRVRSGWFFDENGYEPWVYDSLVAQVEGEQALAQGQTARALTLLGRATFGLPEELNLALAYADARADAGQTAAAVGALTGWYRYLARPVPEQPSGAIYGGTVADLVKARMQLADRLRALKAPVPEIPPLAQADTPDASEPAGPGTSGPSGASGG